MYRQQTSSKNLPVVQFGDLDLNANCSTVTINYKLPESERRVKHSCKLHITSQYIHETYTPLCKGHIASHYMKRILRSPKFAFVHLRLPWLTSVCLGSPQFPLVHPRLPWFTLVCLGSPPFALVHLRLPWFTLVCLGSP